MDELEKTEMPAEGMNAKDSELSPTEPEETIEKSAVPIDYAALARSDVEELSSEFSELSELTDITELENPLRYAALRDLGLTAAEAYLATTKNRHKADNRSHLFGTKMVSSTPLGVMSERELESARELFSDMSDAQIRKLYKKVTKV